MQDVNATNPAVRFIERVERSRKVAGKKIHLNVAQKSTGKKINSHQNLGQIVKCIGINNIE